jgi:ATP-dependent helicase/nuclease subunit B
LPGLVLTKGSDPLRNRSPAGISSVRELGGRLAAEFRGRVELADESEPLIRAKWNGLYELARERSDWHISLRRSLRGLGYFNAAELEKGARECEPDEPFLASVSELERFAECPFRHFAEYTLRLEPRLEAELQAVDLGTICHDILERLIAGLVEEKKSVTDLDDAEIIERVDQFTQQVLGRVEADMLLSDARNAYLLDRSREHLGRVVRWQRRASQVGAFQPRAVEFPFGMGSRLDAPLKLTTPGGREIHLRGKIDRVDIAELGKDLVGVVIDYKRTTERRLIPAKVFHGLTLQLVGYLLALKQTGKTLTGRSIRPVGAFYLPLLESFKAVHHPEEESKSSMKLRGVLETESLALVDSSVQAGGGSEFLQAKLKKDGDPDARSDLVDGEQMKLLMTHVGQRMGELADGILDGNVAVAPYSLSRKRPCSFCPMQAVCRFEIETQPPRYLDSMKKKDMLDRLDEAKQKKEQS